MIIEQLSTEAAGEAMRTSALTGRVDLGGVSLLVLQNGRILMDEAKHRCTVHGSTQEALTPHQLAQSGELGQRLRTRGLIPGRARL